MRRARQRLNKATDYGEALALLWCDVLVGSTHHTADSFPKSFASPYTGERLQADRYYLDYDVAIGFNGPQHDVEIQAQTQADFAQRMFYYFARLHRMHQAPIYPIAVYAFDEVNRDEPNTVTVDFPDLHVLHFQFRQIYLAKLNWRDYMNQPNSVVAALMVKMGYEAHERPRVKAECIRILATLELDKDKTRFIGRFVEAYLSLDTDETVAYNEIMEAIPMAEKQAVTEILTYWEQLGLEKGRQEGRAEGRTEGMEKMRRVMARMVEAKFGPMPAKDALLFEQLSPDKLEEFGLTLATATSYDKLRERFLKR